MKPVPAQVRPNPWLDRYYSAYYTGERTEERRSIVILVGSLAISGGAYVILQHAQALVDRGWDVTLCPLMPPPEGPTLQHPEGLAVLPLHAVRDIEFDIALATWWPTVGRLSGIRARHYVSFVQSIESRFDEGRHAAVVEATYALDLPVITIASWIQAYLAFEHQRPSFLALNGLDRSVFHEGVSPIDPEPRPAIRALVEGSVTTSMKGVEEAIVACRAAGITDIWLLSPSEGATPTGVTRHLSGCSHEMVARVMRSCDVLVKASHVEGMFGPPLEMLATGGAVVSYRVTGADEYLRDGENALLVPTGDIEGLAAALSRLVQEPGLLDRLRSKAAASVSAWPDWALASARFVQVLDLIAVQPRCDGLALRRQFELIKMAGPEIVDLW